MKIDDPLKHSIEHESPWVQAAWYICLIAFLVAVLVYLNGGS